MDVPQGASATPLQREMSVQSLLNGLWRNRWVLLVSAGLQALVGLLSAEHASYAVMVMVVLLSPVLIFRVPFEWLFAALLILASDVAPYTYFPEVVRVGGTGLYPMEAVLVLLIVRMLVVDWPRYRNPLTASPITLPILLFLAALLTSITLGALDGGASLHEAGNAFRGEALFLVVPILALGLRDMGQVRRVVNSFMVIASIIATMYVLQFLLGTRVTLFPDAKILVNSFEEAEGQIRNYAGGIYYSAALLVASILVVQDVSRARRRMLFLAVALAFAMAALSFVRAVWYGTFVAFAIMCVFGRRSERAGYLRLLGSVVATFGIGVVCISGVTGVGNGSLLDVLWRRLISPVTGTVTTVASRVTETEAAWHSFTQSPFFGVGATPLSLPLVYDPTADISRVVPDYFLHDGYIWLLAYVGVLGTVPLLLAVVLGAFRALRGARGTTSEASRPLLLALGAGIVAILVQSITSNRFYDISGEMTLATLLGLSEAILRLTPDTATDGRSGTGRRARHKSAFGGQLLSGADSGRAAGRIQPGFMRRH